jgi:hypothetical protein
MVMPFGLDAVWRWMKRFSWDPLVGGFIAAEPPVDFVGGGGGEGEMVFDEEARMGVGGGSGFGEEGQRKNLTLVI